MAYVQQICDGYSKTSLMGNWYEERLYPQQAFREKQEKQVHAPSCRLAKKIRESPASTAPASRGPSPASREEESGRLPAESSSMTAW